MKRILMTTVVSAAIFTAFADSEPAGAQQQELAAALVPAVQTPKADLDVTLARFSLVSGRHRNVYGLDFGILGNMTTEDMMGFALSGLFNHVGSSHGSLQFAGILNCSKGEFDGLQVAVANYVSGEAYGLQIGCANVAKSLYGMQCGVLNKAQSGEGFQLGVINTADELVGVQIGLINLNQKSQVRMAPIFNCYFP